MTQALVSCQLKFVRFTHPMLEKKAAMALHDLSLTALMHAVDLIAQQLHSSPVNRGVLGLHL